MVSVIILVLLILGFVLFLLAMWPIPSTKNLVAAGLASWILAEIVRLLANGTWNLHG